MEKHYCINCGKEATHQHHVVPKSLGGNNDKNLVWLCDNCHGIIHGIEYNNGQLSHSQLIKNGMEKAREKRKRKIGDKCISVREFYERIEKFYNFKVDIEDLFDIIDDLPQRAVYFPK